MSTLNIAISQTAINVTIEPVINWAVVFSYLLQENGCYILQEDVVSKIAQG